MNRIWGKAVVVGVTTVGLIIAATTSAEAHCTLDTESVPNNTDHTVGVRAPVEELNTHNQRVVVEVPKGFVVHECLAPEQFTCVAAAPDASGRSVVTFTRTTPPRANVLFASDTLRMALRTPTASGKYPFEVNQFYANGTSAHWDGPEDGERPAPVLAVTAGGPPVVNDTPPPTEVRQSSPSPSPVTSARRATTTTGLAVALDPSPTSTVPGTASTSSTTGNAMRVASEPSDDNGPPLGLIGVGIVAVGSGIGALVYLRRRAGAIS